MGKRIAIIFPGIGYSSERPLLYYSRKVLQKNGYEVINVNYQGTNLWGWKISKIFCKIIAVT